MTETAREHIHVVERHGQCGGPTWEIRRQCQICGWPDTNASPFGDIREFSSHLERDFIEGVWVAEFVSKTSVDRRWVAAARKVIMPEVGIEYVDIVLAGSGWNNAISLKASYEEFMEWWRGQ